MLRHCPPPYQFLLEASLRKKLGAKDSDPPWKVKTFERLEKMVLDLSDLEPVGCRQTRDLPAPSCNNGQDETGKFGSVCFLRFVVKSGDFCSFGMFS